MLRKTLFLAAAAILVALTASPPARAWYTYHYRYGPFGYHYRYHYGPSWGYYGHPYWGGYHYPSWGYGGYYGYPGGFYRYW
jgi:hypothetical protein